MSYPLKPLHLATSLELLNDQVTLPPSVPRAKAQILIEMLQKLFNKAEEERLSGDEEAAYVLYMKFVALFNNLRINEEYKKNTKHFDSMIDKSRILKALDYSESLRSSLSARYEGKVVKVEETEIEKDQEKPTEKNQEPKLPTQLRNVPDQEKSFNLAISNGSTMGKTKSNVNLSSMDAKSTLSPSLSLQNLSDQDTNMQITLQDIKSKPFEEKRLREALAIHDKLNTKTKQLEDLGEDISQLNDNLAEKKNRLAILEKEIQSQEDCLKEMEANKKEFNAEIVSLKQLPAFLDQEEVDELCKKLEDIKTFAAALRDVEPSHKASNSASCPICFEAPKQVFSCVDCDSWICENCLGKLEVCPSCQMDFQDNAPKRNRTAEKLLGI